jgi:hypothetical protein
MPLSSVVGAQSIVKPGVCTSSTKPASPYDGQVIYMTDVDQTAVWDGSSWVVLAPIASGRNVIINGAMQVAQRGTSTASITAGDFIYRTADRFNTALSSLGTWTESVENDAPTGSGLRKSLKFLCTTADASPAAADYFIMSQSLEGQNVQQFAKGTSAAKSFALSFWVKSNVTGTYTVNLRDVDNTRSCAASYSISATATWEKKTIIFPADTTGAFDNDNAASLRLVFNLAIGSNYSSGTLQTTWGANVDANLAVGQTNLASATNNYWQITGVQLEAGAVATPFEFEDYGTTLAKCQRYCYVIGKENNNYSPMGFTGNTRSSIYCLVQTRLPQNMRGAPTVTIDSASNFTIDDGPSVYTPTAFALDRYSANAIMMVATISSGTVGRGVIVYGASTGAGVITISSEL